MMFFINYLLAGGSLILAGFVYKYTEIQIEKKATEDFEVGKIDEGGHADWKAPRRFEAVRGGLLALKESDMQYKYWRPFILFLCKVDQEKGDYIPQKGMINLIAQLMKRGKGLSIVAGVVVGDYEEKVEFVEEGRKKIKDYMKKKKIDGFPELVCAPTEADGHKFLIHAKGMGALRPNTVMIGWPQDILAMADEKAIQYAQLVDTINIAKKTLLM